MRLKGGMSLRNFMWHGPRNDIIIQNVIYTKWPKEINYQESMRASLPRHFFWRQFAWATVLPVHLLLLAQANKAEQKEAVRLYCIRVYVILN